MWDEEQYVQVNYIVYKLSLNILVCASVFLPGVGGGYFKGVIKKEKSHYLVNEIWYLHFEYT